MDLLFLEELTREEADQLRDQKVDLDDWNFMLFFPNEEGYWDELEKIDFKGNKTIDKQWQPKSHYLTRMIEGGYGYDTNWYEGIKFRGKVWGLGVQHH